MAAKTVRIGKTCWQDVVFQAALVVTVVGAVAGVIMSVKQISLEYTQYAIAAAAAGVVGFIVRGWMIGRAARWLTPADDGFVLEDRRGRFEFADTEITDLGTWANPRYSGGVPKAITRNCHLTLDADDSITAMEFTYEFPLDTDDPLTDFLNRNLDRLTEQADADVKAGRPFAGNGWLISRDGFAVQIGKTDEVHTIDDLSAVDVIDGNVSVWVGDRAEASIKLPAGSPNALILARLLGKIFDARPPRPDDTGAGLGRILYQRDHSTHLLVLVGVLAFCGLMALVGVLGTAASAFEKDPQAKPIVVFAVVALAGPGFALLAVKTRRKVFRCHTRGVCLETTSRTRKLRYADVAAFTYSATRHYNHGIYTGTQISISFAPRPGADGDAIDYGVHLRNADAEIDNLRDHIARVVASAMLERLKGGSPVPWAAGAVFHPSGLEVPTPKTFGRGEPRHFGYETLTGTDMQNGTFYLFAKGEPKSVFQASVSETNFFPGLTLLLMILSARNEVPA
ncbi:MAG: hypothetical protein ACRC7O_14660 [Fimbriiglobus sp.]